MYIKKIFKLEYRQECGAGVQEEIIWPEHIRSHYRDDVGLNDDQLHTEDTIEIITDYDEEIDYCDPIR